MELFADALRFFLLYTLLPNGAIAVSLEDAAVIGGVAGLANQLVSKGNREGVRDGGRVRGRDRDGMG